MPDKYTLTVDEELAYRILQAMHNVVFDAEMESRNWENNESWRKSQEKTAKFWQSLYDEIHKQLKEQGMGLA